MRALYVKSFTLIHFLNGKLYFEGDDGTTGNELYMLDPATLSITKVFKDSLEIYPNPTSDKINIAFASQGMDSRLGKLAITNILGKTIHTQDFIIESANETLSINLNQSMLPGLYTLTIWSGNKTSSHKFIKTE